MSSKDAAILKSINVKEYIEMNLVYLDNNSHIPLCRSLATSIRDCRDAGKHGLAMLIIMAITIDVGGEIREAIEAWAPISARVGNPVSVQNVPIGKGRVGN